MPPDLYAACAAQQTASAATSILLLASAHKEGFWQTALKAEQGSTVTRTCSSQNIKNCVKHRTVSSPRLSSGAITRCISHVPLYRPQTCSSLVCFAQAGPMFFHWPVLAHVCAPATVVNVWQHRVSHYGPCHNTSVVNSGVVDAVSTAQDQHVCVDAAT